MYEDTDFWPFKCPNCRNEFTEQVGRINAGGQVICPQCRIWLTDHDKEFVVHLAKARNGLFDPWGDMFTLKCGQ